MFLRKHFIIAVTLFALSSSRVLAQSVCGAADGYLLDWNDESFVTSSLAYSTTVLRDGAVPGQAGSDPLDIDISFTGATGSMLAGFPVDSNFFQGGFGAGAESLAFAADFNATDVNMFLEINFEEDVFDLKFDIFDVDYLAASNGTGGFRDSVTITGTNSDGDTALPDLTTPFNAGTQGQFAPGTVYVGNPIASNRGVGNPSNGNGASSNNQNLGNVTITFDEPVNRVVIAYATRSDFFNTTNPSPQGAALYDLEFCIPKSADLTFQKEVSLHSESSVDCGVFPGAPDPAAQAAIPGACLQYDITVENIGSGLSSATDILDQLSPSMIFAGATHSGFDTSDPGFSFNTPAGLTDCGALLCEVEIKDGILDSGDQGVITVRVIIK